MTIKIGINGFGRIGRNVLRSAIQNFSDIEVVGINDLLEPDYLAYMLQYDSVHGRFKGTVAVDGNTLIVNGKKIRLTQERDPANLKWNEVGADVVIESTGLFLDKVTAQKHIDAGAKKVILRNVLGAKYDRILKPMGDLVLVPDNAKDVTQRYMFMETLFHELSHSLGPGSITVGGRKTTVDQELKEIAGGFEEAKADVMGAYNILHMMDQGVIPNAERPQIRATYVAGLFRAMRFGIGEAHGRGAAMQYRYLRQKGVLAWDRQAKRFRIDPNRIDLAIRDLVGEIVRLQGNGDYAGTKAFLDKYAVLDPEAQQVIDSMSHIPVDIRPIYPSRI